MGRWREGFVLDCHVLSSTYVGDDEFGHPRFETQRSDLGELLYRLKYQGQTSAIDQIAEAAAAFVRQWSIAVDVVVPVPPSLVARPHRPVALLAKALGDRLGLPCLDEAVTKQRSTPQLKDVFDYNERLSLLAGAFVIAACAVRGSRVLLVDDLYRSGATMNAVASVLFDQGGAAEVYALAMTRTRRR